MIHFLKFKDKLSYFIDTYKVVLSYDYYSAANGVINKEGLVKINDSSNKFQSTRVRMYPFQLKFYFPEINMHKVLQEITTKEINNEHMTMPVLDAIKAGLLSPSWAEAYSPG